MKKVLVTGGGGFVGLAVVKELTTLGVDISVLGRNFYPSVEKLGATCICGDIRDLGCVLDACRQHDTVFHLAAKAGIWGSYESYYATNVTGTQNIIDACIQNGVSTLVYTSTPSVVFDRGDLEGVDESIHYAENVLCHYAETKIIAEKLVLQANSDQLKTTALRPHLIWGPGDTNLIPRLLDRGRERSLKIVGTGLNKVDISYIDNVASAHILAALNLKTKKTAAGQAFFISQGEPVVLWDWINDLFVRLEIPRVTSSVPFWVAFCAGFLMEKLYGVSGSCNEPKMTRFLAMQLAKSHWFSINKAAKILRYSPHVSTEEGMNRLVRWLQE